MYERKVGWNGSGITYDQIHNKWTLISVSSSGIITIKSDGVNSNTSLFNSTGNYNTSGDTMEFGGSFADNTEESTNIYFDDIRVYNVELSSSVMIDVYNENYVAPPPDPVARIVATGGNWNNRFDYLYIETTSYGRFLYGVLVKGSNNFQEWSPETYMEYEPSDGKFYDVGPLSPYKWGIDDTGTNTSAFPTAANMPIQYWYNEDGSLLQIQFDNPYYVAPEPVERLVATAGSWNAVFDY